MTYPQVGMDYYCYGNRKNFSTNFHPHENKSVKVHLNIITNNIAG